MIENGQGQQQGFRESAWKREEGHGKRAFLIEQIHIKRAWTSVEVAACLDVGAGEDNRPSVVLAGLVMRTALDKNKIKYPKSMC